MLSELQRFGTIGQRLSTPALRYAQSAYSLLTLTFLISWRTRNVRWCAGCLAARKRLDDDHGRAAVRADEGRSYQCVSLRLFRLVVGAGGVFSVVLHRLGDDLTGCAQGFVVDANSPAALRRDLAGELFQQVNGEFSAQSVAYGNIVGSCIFNVFFILGTTSIIQPIDIPTQIASFDIWVMLCATGLLVYFARSGATLQRWEGWIFLTSYAAYTGYLISIA